MLAIKPQILETAFGVIGHDAGHRPAEAGERVHAAAPPCILFHAQRRLDVEQPAEGQAHHEKVDFGCLARRGAHERYRQPYPVDLNDPPYRFPFKLVALFQIKRSHKTKVLPE